MTDDQHMTETTVEMVGGVRVEVGNIIVDDYDLPDGTSRHGLTARLHPETGGRLIVGQGCILRLGSGTWEVVDVNAGAGDEGLGSVTLRYRRGRA